MVTLKTIPKDDYLYIKCQGTQDTLEEHKQHTLAVQKAIMEHGSKRVITDELDVKFSATASELLGLIGFYKEKLPAPRAIEKFAVVVDFQYEDLGAFWETTAYNRGYDYKLFHSLEAAEKWIKQ